METVTSAPLDKEKKIGDKKSGIIDKGIITINNLIQLNKLEIPGYQRPYKWSIGNVNQLIDDILLNKDKSAYRLGTLVLHKAGDGLNIVDGQQRTLTILLIHLARSEERRVGKES